MLNAAAADVRQVNILVDVECVMENLPCGPPGVDEEEAGRVESRRGHPSRLHVSLRQIALRHYAYPHPYPHAHPHPQVMKVFNVYASKGFLKSL